MGITWWAVASAFGGTIIGSVLGGTISFWLQKRSLAATKSLHDADRTEVRKALGYAIFFKMIRLCSDLQQLGNPVKEAIERAKREGHADELWARVMPILRKRYELPRPPGGYDRVLKRVGIQYWRISSTATGIYL